MPILRASFCRRSQILSHCRNKCGDNVNRRRSPSIAIPSHEPSPRRHYEDVDSFRRCRRSPLRTARYHCSPMPGGRSDKDVCRRRSPSASLPTWNNAKYRRGRSPPRRYYDDDEDSFRRLSLRTARYHCSPLSGGRKDKDGGRRRSTSVGIPSAKSRRGLSLQLPPHRHYDTDDASCRCSAHWQKLVKMLMGRISELEKQQQNGGQQQLQGTTSAANGGGTSAKSGRGFRIKGIVGDRRLLEMGKIRTFRRRLYSPNFAGIQAQLFDRFLYIFGRINRTPTLIQIDCAAHSSFLSGEFWDRSGPIARGNAFFDTDLTHEVESFDDKATMWTKGRLMDAEINIGSDTENNEHFPFHLDVLGGPGERTGPKNHALFGLNIMIFLNATIDLVHMRLRIGGEDGYSIPFLSEIEAQRIIVEELEL
ncbi:hypothetical protein niasHT_027081 [Heterodera trifolii]|uniref:Uncharacterized protein n=1 Tax=Heterodera trifolii TaxID=157864 RepID=A0ABD2JGE6_9BILA